MSFDWCLQNNAVSNTLRCCPHAMLTFAVCFCKTYKVQTVHHHASARTPDPDPPYPETSEYSQGVLTLATTSYNTAFRCHSHALLKLVSANLSTPCMCALLRTNQVVGHIAIQAMTATITPMVLVLPIMLFQVLKHRQASYTGDKASAHEKNHGGHMQES